MTQILLIAHGSRNQLANQEIAALTEQLAKQCQRPVRYAFLDHIAQPNISEVIDSMIENQAQQIIVLPYFLNSGNHVQQDIPTIIAQKQKEYPQTAITITKHVGADDMMVQLLNKLIL